MATSSRFKGAGQHAHGRSGFSSLARSAMNANANANADASSFMAQMGSSRSPQQAPGLGYAHGRPATGAQVGANTRPFNPPSAPAAMRAGGSPGGTTFRGTDSVQWRPNPLGSSMQAANDIERRVGGQGLVRTGTQTFGLGDGWYR